MLLLALYLTHDNCWMLIDDVIQHGQALVLSDKIEITVCVWSSIGIETIRFVTDDKSVSCH